jgi:hypothetical protein
MALVMMKMPRKRFRIGGSNVQYVDNDLQDDDEVGMEIMQYSILATQSIIDALQKKATLEALRGCTRVFRPLYANPPDHAQEDSQAIETAGMAAVVPNSR